MYIRSLHDPATAQLQPLLDIAFTRRDNALERAKDALLAQGYSKEDARKLACETAEVQTEQRTISMLMNAWTSVEAGHWRDAYNMTSLLSMFDLANLRLHANQQGQTKLSDVLAALALKLQDAKRWELFSILLDKEGLLQPDKSRLLLEMLAAKEDVFYGRLDNFIEYWRAVRGEELASADAAGWTSMFEEKYTDLKRFLNKAIELNEPVVVSY